MPAGGYDTVYYSNFWYSRHYRRPNVDFGGNLFKDEIKQHKFQFRLLSIIFPKIYIPRTHLITQAFSLQHKIPDQILDSADFKFLNEQGIFRISSYPGLDGKQDNERIIQRKALTTKVIYPDDEIYLSKIPINKLISVDSKVESKGNFSLFPEYGEFLCLNHKEIGDKFIEVVKNSGIEDIPFFHENFIRLLREQFDRDVFEKIWRETNSIYLINGAREHESLIPYFNEEIESVNFRLEPHGIDRYLFSPTSIYSFLGMLLTTEEMSKLLYGPITKSLKLLSDADFRYQLKAFREEYLEIARSISRAIKMTPLKFELNQLTLSNLFGMALDGQFEKGASVVGEVLDDVSKLAKLGDLDGTGLISGFARSGLRFGGNYVKRLRRRHRFPATAALAAALKISLQEVSDASLDTI